MVSREFLGPLIYLQDANKNTLSIGLTLFQQQQSYDVTCNLLMAASSLVVLPVVILFLLFQKRFISGLDRFDQVARIRNTESR
jgi:multiple sugar transport system permease protein